MTFRQIVAEVVEWLRQDKRVSYRALKRQFALDDDYLDDLKNELIGVQRVAVDDRHERRGLADEGAADGLQAAEHHWYESISPA